MPAFENSLLADEHVIFRTSKHLIIFLPPLICFILSVLLASYMQHNPVLIRVSWTPWLVTLLLWLAVGIQYYTAEVLVTNQRILLQEGLIYQHRNMTRLSAIANIQVEQSLLGRYFNYGTVIIYSFGVPDAFYLISQPHQLQHHVNAQLDKIASSAAK